MLLILLADNGFTAFSNLLLSLPFIYCAKMRQQFLISGRMFWFPCTAIPVASPYPPAFPYTEPFTGYALQSSIKSLRVHTSVTAIMCWVLCKLHLCASLMGLVLRGFISNPRCLETPIFYYNSKAPHQVDLSSLTGCFELFVPPLPDVWSQNPSSEGTEALQTAGPAVWSMPGQLPQGQNEDEMQTQRAHIHCTYRALLR